MSLEELNDKLHGRDAHLSRTRTPDIFHPEENKTNPEVISQFQQTKGWGEDSLPAKLKVPEIIQPVIAPDERGKKRRKMLALILGGLAVILLVGGIVFKLRTGIFSEDNIAIGLFGPAEAKSAELVTFDFEYANNNWMDIKGAVIVFEYPDSFHPEALPKLVVNKSRAEYALGDVLSQTKGKITLSGKFSGTRGDQARIGVTFRYTPSAFSSVYEKRVERNIAVVSSPLFLEMSAPFELASDQEVQYEIKYGNLGESSFSNLKVKLDYPTEFVFTEAVPMPSEKNTIWDIGTLDGREEGTIVVRGRLTGGRDEQKLVSGGIGIFQGDGTFLVYDENSRKTKIVASPLSIRQQVNSENGAVNPGAGLRYEIDYRNDGNVGIRDAIVSMSIDSPYLDFRTLKFEGDRSGAYDQSRKIIYWKASDLPFLRRIEPGQSGKVAFSVNVFTDLEKRFPGVQNPTIQSVAKIDSPDIPAIVGITKVVASATLSLKLNTVVTDRLQGFYSDTVIPNTGPMPPVVGQETTYTFHLSYTNSTNDVKDGRTSILLPSGIRYTGKKSPDNEKIIYNERSNELIWDLGLLSPATTRELVFQVSAIPSVGNIDSSVVLITRTAFTGKDAFTGKEFRLENDKRESNVPDDLTMASIGGRVRSAP